MTTLRSAVPDWFDPALPRLVGRRCRACSSIFFPPTLSACRNPACRSEELEVHHLSDRGTVWSWVRNHYKPPAPYLATEPFEPYVVLAVDLESDGMVVLGQLSPASPEVEVGTPVALCSEVLLEDENGPQMVWRWTRADDRTEVAS